MYINRESCMFSLEINATSLFFFLFNKMIRSLTRIYTFSTVHTFRKFIITAAHSKEKCQRVIWNCDCSINIRPIGDEQDSFVINGHRLKEIVLLGFFLKDADILFRLRMFWTQHGSILLLFLFFSHDCFLARDCIIG